MRTIHGLGIPWTDRLADYDLTRGRLWILVPVATLLAPAAVRARQRSDAGHR